MGRVVFEILFTALLFGLSAFVALFLPLACYASAVVQLTTVFCFDDLFCSMKGKTHEPGPIRKDNETHQSARNFTGTHKTA